MFKEFRLRRNIARLSYQDAQVRVVAARSLGKMGDKQALESLIAALRDWDRDVRLAAAKALVKINPSWARSEAAHQQVLAFIAALRDENRAVRRAAAETLGQIGDNQAAEPLIAALRDRDEYIRRAAAQALGQIGDTRAVQALIAARQDRDSEVRWVAAKALAKIDPGWARSETVRPNQSLLPYYPHLFCQLCGLKATCLKISLGFLDKERFAICRGCNSSLNLLPGVCEVKGLIGCDGEIRHECETVLVRLWSETDKTARNADIDYFIIQAGKVENYDQAVNAVINMLKSDASRPATWCKQIPVMLQGNLPLSQGTLNMLKATFREVHAE